MDIVYIFRHSKHQDIELCYSLRSVSRHCPWVRKVWVFGDRPVWLSNDTRFIEHVPHEAIAWLHGYKTPVTNMFLMLFLISLLPDVSPDFVLFCDDYILLDEFSEASAMTPRYLQNLDEITGAHKPGLYQDALWRTYELLKRLNYPRLNYEVHVPLHFTKRRVLAAVKDFRDYLTEDRFYGPLSQLTVMNHACAREGFQPRLLSEENLYAGFHYKPFTSEEIREKCEGKLFLNFDDVSFNVDIQQFLDERFPRPCRYEAAGQVQSGSRDPAMLPDQSASLPVSTNERVLSGDPQNRGVPALAEDDPIGIPGPNWATPSQDPGRCVILVPHRDGIVPTCEAGLQELERRGYKVRRVGGCSAIDRARCQMASDALGDGFTETMWIDSDIGFKADDVEQIRRRGVPLCCGIYPKKGQRALAVHVLPGTTEIHFGKKGGLIELLYAATGFLHVRREVYDAIQHRLGLPMCGAEGKRPLVPYFQPLVRPRGDSSWYLSEDFAFCHRARQCGIPIIADTTIRLAHIGDAEYSWEEAGTPRQRFESYRYVLA